MAGVAHADPACLTRQQAVADAALRYEARLRITGLTCDGYKQYQLFAGNNGTRYEAYIAAMRDGSDDEAVDRYDAYETGLQNAESLRAAAAGAADYCRTNKPLLDEAELDSAQQVDRATVRFAMANTGPLKVCR